MEITARGLKCNSCGTWIFQHEEYTDTWAFFHVVIPHIHLDRVIHLCPMCFQEIMKMMHSDDTSVDYTKHRYYDPELQRQLDIEHLTPPDPVEIRDEDLYADNQDKSSGEGQHSSKARSRR